MVGPIQAVKKVLRVKVRVAKNEGDKGVTGRLGGADRKHLSYLKRPGAQSTN